MPKVTASFVAGGHHCHPRREEGINLAVNARLFAREPVALIEDKTT